MKCGFELLSHPLFSEPCTLWLPPLPQHKEISSGNFADCRETKAAVLDVGWVQNPIDYGDFEGSPEGRSAARNVFVLAVVI